jgi:hypothetical protein
VPNPRKQDRELDALYATLPAMECQGYCHDSCGPIDPAVREKARVIERARKDLTCGAYATCSMLTEDRRCSVYDIRPMICRLWGLVRSMPCPYGCRPEGGLLPDEEGVRLLVECERIGGSPLGDRATRIMAQMVKALSDEELRVRGQAIFNEARGTVEGRVGALPPTAIEKPLLVVDRRYNRRTGGGTTDELEVRSNGRDRMEAQPGEHGAHTPDAWPEWREDVGRDGAAGVLSQPPG